MIEKTCFVVAPIGEEGSETRKRSDQVLKHVIRPAVQRCGYHAIRADEISEPGVISNQVIQRLVNDELVIVDLSNRSPNVFYELAIRHVTRKPLVQLIQKGELLPFDVAGTRAISVDHRDLDSVDAAKEEIIQQIRSLEQSSEGQESPISLALDLELLRGSNDPQHAALADLAERLTAVQGSILRIEGVVTKQQSRKGDVVGSKADQSTLGKTVRELQKDLTAAISTIIADVKEQQANLARRIQTEFIAQSHKSCEMVEAAFAKEVCKFVAESSSQNQLLRCLVESFMEGLRTMGEFQRINVDMETSASASELENRIRDSISKISDDVGDLRDTILALPSSISP